MVMQKFKCENCSAELPTADSVCAQCDEKLLDADDSLLKGQHICPICSARFDNPESSAFPLNAKWYVPQTYSPQCPHCKVKLRDRKNPKYSLWEIAGLVGFYIGNSFIADREIRLMMFAVVMIFLLTVVWLRTEWTVPNESRYASDDSLPKI
jgi:hypothetical protein